MTIASRPRELQGYRTGTKAVAHCVAKQMSARKFERAIVDAICGKVLTSDFLTDLVECVNVFLADNERYEREIDTNQKQLRCVEKAIANLLDMAELHPSADVIARLNERDWERLYQQIEQRKKYKRRPECGSKHAYGYEA